MQGLFKADAGESPQYAQLFFYDPAYPADVQARRNPEVDSTTLHGLTDMPQAVNTFILMYKTAYLTSTLGTRNGILLKDDLSTSTLTLTYDDT